jgi:hypothetical protein
MNKGNKNIPEDFLDIRVLENIGREAHSYLSYIVQQYESLPEVVVFTQAEFRDHFATDSISVLLELAQHAASVGFSRNPALVSSEPGGPAGRDFRLSNYNGPLEQSEYCLGEWWDQCIVEPNFPESEMYVYWGAIFATRKDRIKSRPKVFYQKLLECLSSPSPETAHYMERSWFYIFNHHELLR